MPSFVASNSMNNNTIAPSLAQATGPPLAAAPTHSSPSSVSGMLGGPSSLAELDAVTVITCRTNIYIDNIPFLLPFGCFTPQTYVFVGERNPVHHTLLDPRLEGGRGKGDDNGPLATHVPQPANPRWALQGYPVKCELGARGFASSSTACGRGRRDPVADWKLQGLGAAMAEESYSSGAGREHTNNHTSTSMCGDHHPAYAITSSCSAR